MEAAPSALGRPFEEVALTTTDRVNLKAWFFPADAGSNRVELAALYCNGNAGNMSHRLDSAGALLETGCSVLLFDYRGYGGSDGRPSEEGTYLDAQAAYRWLKQRGFKPENILVFGESLGGGVACELATRERLGGLMIQSSFKSIPDLGAELFPWLPVRWLATIHYNTHAKIGSLKCPVLILHSRSDRLVGFHHAQANFEKARDPKLLWELAGDHNEALEDPDNFKAGVEKFLKLIGKAPAPEAGKSPY
jgi:hypothetical protein